MTSVNNDISSAEMFSTFKRHMAHRFSALKDTNETDGSSRPYSFSSCCGIENTLNSQHPHVVAYTSGCDAAEKFLCNTSNDEGSRLLFGNSCYESLNQVDNKCMSSMHDMFSHPSVVDNTAEIFYETDVFPNQTNVTDSLRLFYQRLLNSRSNPYELSEVCSRAPGSNKNHTTCRFSNPNPSFLAVANKRHASGPSYNAPVTCTEEPDSTQVTSRLLLIQVTPKPVQLGSFHVSTPKINSDARISECPLVQSQSLLSERCQSSPLLLAAPLQCEHHVNSSYNLSNKNSLPTHLDTGTGPTQKNRSAQVQSFHQNIVKDRSNYIITQDLPSSQSSECYSPSKSQHTRHHNAPGNLCTNPIHSQPFSSSHLNPATSDLSNNSKIDCQTPTSNKMNSHFTKLHYVNSPLPPPWSHDVSSSLSPTTEHLSSFSPPSLSIESLKFDNDSCLPFDNDPSTLPSECIYNFDAKLTVCPPQCNRRDEQSTKPKRQGGRSSAEFLCSFPGVSWNTRMQSWLVYYEDRTGRKSKTFNPKRYSLEKFSRLGVRCEKLRYLNSMSLAMHCACAFATKARYRAKLYKQLGLTVARSGVKKLNVFHASSLSNDDACNTNLASLYSVASPEKDKRERTESHDSLATPPKRNHILLQECYPVITRPHEARAFPTLTCSDQGDHGILPQRFRNPVENFAPFTLNGESPREAYSLFLRNSRQLIVEDTDKKPFQPFHSSDTENTFTLTDFPNAEQFRENRYHHLEKGCYDYNLGPVGHMTSTFFTQNPIDMGQNLNTFHNNSSSSCILREI